MATELSSYASGIDADPARLAGVQARIAALTGLKRKFGPTLDDVLQWAEKAAVRVGDLDLDDDAIAGLEQERQDLLDQATQLRRRRPCGRAPTPPAVSNRSSATN